MRRDPFRTGIPMAMLAAFAAAGCVDSGLPGENLPLEDARTKAPVYDMYDDEHRAGPVRWDDRDWLAAGPAVAIARNLLMPVAAAGENVFRLASDGEHPTRLYIRTEAGLVPLAPSAVQGEAPAAAEAEHH